MKTVVLFEEYRFIERSENEISSAWKGTHLLLFFLAFIFGSFCTFCFHMLMYLFDEKCVLFPKLLSLSSMQHNVLYEFLPTSKEISEMLPVDFVSTQWVDKSICYLPTFVPLVSGICGLIWTTMFLMCSTGSQTLTGLQRPWRVLPPVFLFSLTIGGVCMHASYVTHSGLQALCFKLGELTNSTTCSYSINVATLAYERRIRGVYQAIKLTIATAWLHTFCWILSAVLVIARVLLAVDFQLVKVSAKLQGDVDRILERHERHIRTVFPVDAWPEDIDRRKYVRRTDIANIIYENKRYQNIPEIRPLSFRKTSSDILYISKLHQDTSEMALVPSERSKLTKISAYKMTPSDKDFILTLLYDLVKQSLEIIGSSDSIILNNLSLGEMGSEQLNLFRQFGQEMLVSKTLKINKEPSQEPENMEEETQTATDIQLISNRAILDNELVAITLTSYATETDSAQSLSNVYNSFTHISEEMTNTVDRYMNIGLNQSEQKRLRKLMRKSNQRKKGTQTDKLQNERRQRKDNITESRSTLSVGTQHGNRNEGMPDKETQTHPKEKQD